MVRMNEEWRLISFKKLLRTMNSRDRVDRENISFEFNVSNSGWRIIIKERMTIKVIKTKTKQKENEKKQKNKK